VTSVNSNWPRILVLIIDDAIYEGGRGLERIEIGERSANDIWKETGKVNYRSSGEVKIGGLGRMGKFLITL
jgi:hypothetical protein